MHIGSSIGLQTRKVNRSLFEDKPREVFRRKIIAARIKQAICRVEEVKGKRAKDQEARDRRRFMRRPTAPSLDIGLKQKSAY